MMACLEALGSRAGSSPAATRDLYEAAARWGQWRAQESHNWLSLRHSLSRDDTTKEAKSKSPPLLSLDCACKLLKLLESPGQLQSTSHGPSDLRELQQYVAHLSRKKKAAGDAAAPPSPGPAPSLCSPTNSSSSLSPAPPQLGSGPGSAADVRLAAQQSLSERTPLEPSCEERKVQAVCEPVSQRVTDPNPVPASSPSEVHLRGIRDRPQGVGEPVREPLFPGSGADKLRDASPADSTCVKETAQAWPSAASGAEAKTQVKLERGEPQPEQTADSAENSKKHTPANSSAFGRILRWFRGPE